MTRTAAPLYSALAVLCLVTPLRAAPDSSSSALPSVEAMRASMQRMKADTSKADVVSAPRPPKRTGKWRPEVVILGRDKKSVSEALVSRMTAEGWSVSNASDFLVSFQKAGNTFVQIMAGIGTQLTVSYNLMETDGNVHVVADIGTLSRNAFGGEQRVDLNGGKPRDQIQAFLDNLAATMSRAVPPPVQDTPPTGSRPDTTAASVAEVPVPATFEEDTTQRVVFGGLRFGDHPAAVTAKLKELSSADTSRTVYTFTGTVAGEANGEVVGVFTPETKRLCRVVLKLRAGQASCASIKSKWEEIATSLATKYGTPKHRLSSPCPGSNGAGLSAIHLGACKMSADWDLGNMTILCDVRTDERVWVTYASPTYATLERTEKAAARAKEF